MNEIKWLQLSDLHFGDDREYSKKSRESLLEHIASEGSDIDYIFVTGDIIFAKNLKTKMAKTKAYKEAEKYLKELYLTIWKEDTGYKEFSKRVFIVPGNHDLIRDEARAGSMKQLLENYSQKGDGSIGESYLKNTNDAMNYFTPFYKSLITDRTIHKKAKDNMHYVIETDNLNVVHINTCIASSGDMDDGRLILGFELLSRTLHQINNKKPSIVIAHHNFDCFAKEEQKQLEILLKEKNICLYLCGHAHERESSFILKYNQQKILNTFTCGTLISTDGKNQQINTIYFMGSLEASPQGFSLGGSVKSFKWTLENGWSADMDFGLVQNIKENYRIIKCGEILNPNEIKLNIGSEDGVISSIVLNPSPQRSLAFLQMNRRAEKSLSIYGIGITSVSKDTDLFEQILKNNGKIRLCMVDLDVFKQDSCIQTSIESSEQEKLDCNLQDTHFCIYSTHIDEYIRNEYYDDIQKSFMRLLTYRKNLSPNKRSLFEIKLLKSFIPISINIINEETDKAELIAEYTMPFTKKRLLLQLNKQKHEDYYEQVKEVFDVIWNKAEEFEDED